MEYMESQWSAAASQVPEDMLLLNVETTGLRASSSFVCMLSAGYRRDNTFFCNTWLAGSRRDEAVMLDAVQELAAGFAQICCYGGNAFAFRFMKERRYVYIDAPLFPDNKLIDLQKSFRPLLQILPLKHLKKEDVERFLRFTRKGINVGKDLLPVYEAWERTKDADAKESLLLHAQEDIRFLQEVCRLNAYLDFLQAKWEYEWFEETPEGICFNARLFSPVPVPVSWSNQCARFELSGSAAQFFARPIEGKLRYFLPGSCRDYYYLPEEDTAIHRSVAQFVDRSKRVKATPETCYAYIPYDKEKWQQDTSLPEKYLAAIVRIS